MSEFSLEDFCRENGIPNGELEPYDYEKYKAINPNLTESMYRKMRQSGALWKIRIGRGHKDKYSGEVLQGVWWLQILSNYR